MSTQEQVSTAVRVNMAIRRERQADIAAVLGVTQAAVSHRMHDKTPWSLDDLDKLADHFGVAVVDLLVWSTPGESVNRRERSLSALYELAA